MVVDEQTRPVSSEELECVDGVCRLRDRTALSSPVTTGVAASDIAIPFGAEWKYWDRPSNLAADWMSAEFDDSEWLQGRAPLGYWFREEGTHIRVESSIDPKPAYFRHTFDLTELPQTPGKIRLGVHRHGRVVVYLNGREWIRDNAPKSPLHDVEYWTPSQTEEFPLQFVLNLEYLKLRVGQNVIAVEMRPCFRSICFDLALSLTNRNLNRLPIYRDRPTSPINAKTIFPQFKWLNIRSDREQSVRDFLGWKVILDVIGAQCAPCWEGMPKLEQWASVLKEQGVIVAAICSDGTIRDLKARLEKQAQSFPNIVLGVEPSGGDLYATTAYRELGVSAFPSTFLIDESGIVGASCEGSAGPDYDQFVAQLKAMGIGIPS